MDNNVTTEWETVMQFTTTTTS